MIDDYRPAPGRLVEFVRSEATVVAAETAEASPVPPSFNQRFHVATAERDPKGPRHWLSCAVDLEGQVDTGTLEAAFTHLVHRHEALRCFFRRTDGTQPPVTERFVVPADKYELRTVDHGERDTPEALRRLIAERFAARCHPLGDPSYALCVVLREEGATVVCGFDHGNMDGYSLAVVVHELPEIYEALRAGRAPELLPVDSYVTYCAEEQASLSDELPSRQDPLMQGWGEFFEGCGGTMPAFPLDLGLAPGTRAAQGNDVRQILDAGQAEAFEERALAAGGTFFTGALTAFALAVQRQGGPSSLRMFTPMHTRQDARFQHALGWFTTIAPLTLDVEGAGSALEGASRVKAAFAEARRLAGLSAALVLPVLGDEIERRKDDVFMLSYIDYRKQPGAANHLRRDARYIGSTSTTDDTQFWFTRSEEGLFLRARFPDVYSARRTVIGFVEEVRRTLLADAGR